MKKYFLLIMISTIFYSYGAFLKNISRVIIQPDGRTIDCFITGDEYYNFLHDSEGYTIVKGRDGWYYYGVNSGEEVVASGFRVGDADPKKTGIKRGSVISEKLYKQRASANIDAEEQSYHLTPKSGIINKLAIFIRFSDETDSVFNSQRSYYDPFFNGIEGPSLKHYYKEVSYNQLDISTTYYPHIEDFSTNTSYRDVYPRSYYEPYNETENPGGYTDYLDQTAREHSLIERAILSIALEVPPELDLDAKPDDNVDDVTVLVSGNGGEWANILWPHKGTLYSKDIYINGKKVSGYNFIMTGSPAYFNVGIIAHEFFHLLGAPDLYHYTNWAISEPVGPWDLMAQTTDPPQHMCAWMKYKYGSWLNSLPVIILPRQYSLNPLSSPTGNIFKIKSPYSSEEFFILEYRKQGGIYENSLPGTDDGILIYRVKLGLTGNGNGPPDEIYVYRPAGSLTEHGILENAQFSAQLSRTEFYEWTNPFPYLSTGEFGGISIFDIGEAGETINFSVSFDADANDYFETFDSGNFSLRDWYFEGSAGWVIDNVISYIGSSARSGQITHSQSTSMCLDVNFRIEGEVSFYRKVISQAGYDFLEFRVDGALMGRWSGSNEWDEFYCQVDSGTHKLEWKYVKNPSVSTGSDCGWIDNIYLYGVFEMTFPDGGEVFSKGRQYEISTLDMVGENVRYDLYKSDSYILTISESTPSGAACLWTVPYELEGTDFKIKATSVENSEICDFSAGFFSIINGGVKVTSPSGNETLEMLENYTIEWLDGLDEDIKIKLVKANETVYSFTAPSESQKVWDFYYGDIVSGNNYKIRIESVLDSTVFHESGFFSIIGTNGISGSVAGNWTEISSPYILTDSTYVDSGSVLWIGAGTKVKGSKEKNPFNISGRLESLGLCDDFVQFRDIGLDFFNSTSSDSSKLIYTEFYRSIPSAKTTRTASISINDNSKVIIQNCKIQNLNSYGISINNASPVISDCIISGCAGGIKFSNSSSNYIVNNTITANSGTGIFFDENSDPMLLNNIIYGNGGYEVYINHNDSDPELYYNNIEGGQAGFGLNTGVIFDGAYTQNIISDPSFESNSFKLSAVSPCINWGYPDLTTDVLGYLFIPLKDIYGNYRLNGDIDIGCSEYRLITTPDSPSNLFISSVDGTVSISWDASDYANSYKIYSSDDPYSEYNHVSTVENNSWTSSEGLETKFFYYVIASSESVKSVDLIKSDKNKIKIQKIEDLIRRK